VAQCRAGSSLYHRPLCGNVRFSANHISSDIFVGDRHPQYTGIFIGLFGQLIHWPTVLNLLFFPVIVWAYYHLARKEEKAMISKFGDAYRKYMQSVPMFFPKLKHLRLYLGQANT
jgi:hypothetical protein